MIGRARELEIVRAALARTAHDAGGVMLVLGEAGVGKTQLVGATEREAEALGFERLSGACFPDLGKTPLAPWRQALGPSFVRPSPGSLGALGDRARVFEHVLAELVARAERRPLLVTLEDLHWADRESLELLLHVSRFGLRSAILLVGSVRDPDADGAKSEALEDALAELLRADGCERVKLRPFDQGEVAALAAAVVGAEVPQALVQALTRETAGNALYVRELVRHLAEEQKIIVRDGRVASEYALDALGLPQSIRHVVRRRVSRLPAASAALLRAASLAGGPVSLAALAGAAEIAHEVALEAVDPPLQAGLLTVVGDRYDLIHAVVRRAIAEELNPDRRALLHRRLAEALAACAAVDDAEVAAQYHASRGLPGKEAGVPFARRAAVAAERAGGQVGAVTMLTFALELLPAGDVDERADVAASLAVAHARALDPDAAVRWAREAASLAAAAGRVDLVAELLWRVARELADTGAPRAAYAALVDEGLARAGHRRDLTWARLDILSRAPVPMMAGPIYVARFAGHDPEAVALLRREGTEADVAATADIHVYRPASETEMLAALARRWRDPSAALRVRETCLRDAFFRGEDLRAVDMGAVDLIAEARRVGSFQAELGASVLVGCTAACLGDMSRAELARDRAKELAKRLGALHRLSAVGPLAAAVVIGYLRGGDGSGVLAQLVGFVSAPLAISTPFGLVALNLALVAAATSGDRATVERLLPLQLSLLEALEEPSMERGAGRDCAATAIWALGLTAYARRLLALVDCAVEGAAPWSSREHSRGRALALSGALDEALAALADARAALVADGRRAVAAICDHDSARALVNAGRGADERTRALLDRGEEVFRELGMTPWIASVARLRAESSGAPRRPFALSDREQEVLRALAKGSSNKEIAKMLFVSVPTVERHVANVFGKIGVKSRAAAAAFALKHGLAD